MTKYIPPLIMLVARDFFKWCIIAITIDIHSTLKEPKFLGYINIFLKKWVLNNTAYLCRYIFTKALKIKNL